VRAARLIAALSAALLAGGAAARAQQTGDVQRLTNFSVPTYNDRGELTSKLFGDYARIMPDGLVEITELRAEFYSGGETNRRTDMRVSAPTCFYHRGKGVAMSDSSVRIARENMVVTGDGFLWDSRRESLKIAQNARVVLKDIGRSAKETNRP
jgi:hypothetical protein